MNTKVLHFFGIFLVFIGACMAVPLLIALAYGEYREAGAFLLSSVICITPGIISRLIFKTAVTDEKLALRDSYFIVAVSWFLASLFGSLPYLLTGVTSSFKDALFETASGFTTTGATIFPDVEILPHCILVWRSLTQWLGGMGIIVLFFALLPKFGAVAGTISRAETPGPIQRRIASRYSAMAQRLYLAYIILTGLLFLLLLFGKMSPFDAINHAFTTMATGGFSTYNNGLAHFNSSYIYLVIGLFAFLAGSNFTLFFDILQGRIKEAFKDEEYRRYLEIILVSTVLIFIFLALDHGTDDLFHDFGSAAFHVLNTISTLGFETEAASWPSFCLLILVCLMIMGGCSSSTAGGVKVSRVLLLFKVIRRDIRNSIHGSLVDDITYNRKKIQTDTMNYILSFSILFMTVIGVATLIIALFGGGDLLQDILSLLSCMGNQGPAFDNLGLECCYNTESWICSLTYIFVMIAGRLEITTFLVLFSRHFWNPYTV